MTLVLEEADLTLYSCKCFQCDVTVQRVKEKPATIWTFCSEACAQKWADSLSRIVIRYMDKVRT